MDSINLFKGYSQKENEQTHAFLAFLNFLRNSNKVDIWKIEDPRDGDLNIHRKIRDKIKKKIKNFVEKTN